MHFKYSMNPEIKHDARSDILNSIKQYRRISVKDVKKDCNLDPCLMEILIVAYVIEICKKISKGFWPFYSPFSSNSPKANELYAKGGIIGIYSKYQLSFSFSEYVKKCLENGNFLARAVHNTHQLKYQAPKKETKKRPGPKSVTFKVGDRNVPFNSEIINKFLKNNPEGFVDHMEFFEVMPRAKIDPNHENFQILLKKLAPYAPVVAKTSHQSSNKKQKTGRKKSSSQFSSSSSVEVSDSASEGSASSKVGNSVSQAARLPSSTSNHDDVGPHPYAPDELINEKGMVLGHVLLEIGIDIPGDPDLFYRVNEEGRDRVDEYLRDMKQNDDYEEESNVFSLQEDDPSRSFDVSPKRSNKRKKSSGNNSPDSFGESAKLFIDDEAIER